MFKQILVTTVALGVMAAGVTAQAEEKAEEMGWGGSVAGGLHISTGNTETEDLNFDGKISYDTQTWKHSGRLQAFNKKENNVRTDEEYRLKAHSAYKLSEVEDIFGEVEYVDDRFGGYDYRISEVLGYNRRWMENDEFTWASSVGAGYQHTKTTTGASESAPLGRLQNDVIWKINEHVDFENTLRADISDINVYATETAVKTALSEALYLRLAFQTETLSEVPAGRKKTDTDTLINVGYEF